jgi:hypothetical protein
VASIDGYSAPAEVTLIRTRAEPFLNIGSQIRFSKR